MSLNKVMLIGNVGADPEIRYLDKDNANDNNRVANVRLATSERYKNRNGELVEDTTWHSVACFGRTAELVEKFVKKGTQLYVEGRIRTRLYQDKNGQEQRAFEIRADSIQLLGRRSDGDAPVTTASAPAPAPAPAPTPAPLKPVDDDDLPF